MARETGIGVDARGEPVIDPTKNVLDLTAAANKRQDDLREMHDRVVAAQLGRVEETLKWMEKLSDVHQRHDREIHKMEQEKLAAFRASDEVARLTEANRSLAAIQVVERTLNSTATALASQNAENNLEVNRRLAALEKSSYEGAGKGTGTKSTVTYVVVGVGLLVSLITIGSVVVAIAFAIRG